MDFFDILQVLRRRWLVIAVSVLVGGLAGYVTAPGEREATVYAADTTLVANPQAVSPVNLQQAALLAITGPVPDAVAAELGISSGGLARRRVTAFANPADASIVIVAKRSNPAAAEEVSIAFAESLVESLDANNRLSYDEQVESLTERVNELRIEVELIRGQLGLDEESEVAVGSALESAERRLSDAQSALSDVRTQGPPQAPLLIIERGTPYVFVPPGIRAPDGKPQRAALLAGFGLLVGLGGAFALDRLDTRIRDKSTAELAFGCSVIGEIPPMPNQRKNRNELLALSEPSSPFVEAYRGLRTIVALTAQPSTNGRTEDHRGTVLLVTSPGAGEGKTTTTAHLAAMLAEVGRSVLVVSADLRRPRLHMLFDVEREPGLTDMINDDPDQIPSLAELVKPTSVSRVRILPSGSPRPNPAPLLRQATRILASARQVFDFVLVDTAPMLVANDAAELATVADGVIVMARATRTTIDAAQRTAEMLERLETPVLGAVLIGATDMPSGYAYYRYRYYGNSESRWSLRRHSHKRQPDEQGVDSGTQRDSVSLPSA